MSSIEYIASEDSRDDNILTSTRLDTPCLDESSTKTSSNNNKIVSKNVSFHAQLIIMARSETGLSDIESLDGLISRIESSTPFSTAQSHSESIESNECQDNMSRSMFGESIISISNTQYNKEATKVRIGRSPDEMDTSRNRDIPNVANVSNLKYTSCVDEFVRQVPKLELDITTSLTNDDFSTTKHFCNGSHSRIFKAEMKVGSNPNLKSNSSSSISSIVSNTKRVVLKILSESSVENQVAQKDFQIEIDILTRLQHPHLVNIVGYGSVKSKMGEYFIRPLIALECLQGDTLSYHLGLRRSFHVQPFTKLRYFRIAKEFADVLDYIHTRVHPDFILMHRDLKPDNIGFASDGALKLFDFGLCTCVHRRTQSGKVVAKDSGSAKGSSSPGLTTDTYMLTGCTGSFRYMAPENALEKPYNESVSNPAYFF